MASTVPPGIRPQAVAQGMSRHWSPKFSEIFENWWDVDGAVPESSIQMPFCSSTKPPEAFGYLGWAIGHLGNRRSPQPFSPRPNLPLLDRPPFPASLQSLGDSGSFGDLNQPVSECGVHDMMKKILVVIGCATASISQITSAADRLVPAQYATIQAAIDAAANGDVVQISPGTYTGPVDLKGKAIVVRGVGAASSVVINGGTPVVKFVTAETSNTVLENVTISGGTNPQMDGGGIRCFNSSPTIRDCRILGNSANRGGGVACEGGSPQLIACVIAGNTGSIPNRFPAGAGIFLKDSAARISGCLVTGNQMNVPYDASAGQAGTPGSTTGAGIHAEGNQSVVIERTSVISNQQVISASQCTNAGAGIYIACPGQVNECRISENIISGCGTNVGGIYFASNLVSMTSTRVCSNSGTQLFGAYINLGGNSVSATCPQCAGDLNGDGFIDGTDLGTLLSRWGPCTN